MEILNLLRWRVLLLTKMHHLVHGLAMVRYAQRARQNRQISEDIGTL